jgi:hypothetical protein
MQSATVQPAATVETLWAVIAVLWSVLVFIAGYFRGSQDEKAKHQ